MNHPVHSPSGPSMFQLLHIFPGLKLQQEMKWLHILLFPQMHVNYSLGIVF